MKYVATQVLARRCDRLNAASSIANRFDAIVKHLSTAVQQSRTLINRHCSDGRTDRGMELSRGTSLVDGDLQEAKTRNQRDRSSWLSFRVRAYPARDLRVAKQNPDRLLWRERFTGYIGDEIPEMIDEDDFALPAVRLLYWTLRL
jgi:hypothetical protein